MTVATLDRWQAACAACGFAGVPRDYRSVVRGWSSWGRRYHTLGHLEACLTEFDQVRDLAVRPGEVELALWFHDAVYRTRASDNEARSAELAADIMSRRRAESGAIKRVAAAIMATRHQGNEPPGDAALVLDIDLSILGQPEDVYLEFEENVRREWYAGGCQGGDSRQGDARSWSRFCGVPPCFCFDEFRTRYEAIAPAQSQVGASRAFGG